VTTANSSSGFLGALDPSLASNVNTTLNYLPVAKLYVIAMTIMIVLITISSVVTAIRTKGG